MPEITEAKVNDIDYYKMIFKLPPEDQFEIPNDYAFKFT